MDRAPYSISSEKKGQETGPAKRRGLPIVFLLSLLAGFSVLASALLGIYFFSYRGRYFYQAEVRHNAEMLADSISSQIVHAVYLKDYDLVDEFMKVNVGPSEEVDDALIVLEKDGRVFYDIQGKGEGSREGKIFNEKMKYDGIVYVSRPMVLTFSIGYGGDSADEVPGRLLLGFRERDYMRNERLRAMILLARSVSRNVSATLDRGDYVSMRDIMVNMVGGSRNLVYAELMNNDGNVLFYYEPGISRNEQKAVEGRIATDTHSRRALKVSDRKSLLIQDIVKPRHGAVIDIAVPIMRKGNKIGVARIGYSMEDFLSAQNRTRELIALMAVVFVLVGIALAVLTSTRISIPIRRLAHKVREAGTGNLGERIPVSGRIQEVMALGDAFNQMISDRTRAEDQRAQMERQLFQAQKMEAIGQLAGGVAHDFNNMLGVIIGYAEILLSRAEPGSDDAEALEQVLAAAERSRDLTLNLLTFARQDMPRIKPVNLKQMVDGLSGVLAMTLSKGIELKTRVPEALCVNADENQLYQALLNLCINAGDAMGKEGTLTIEAGAVEIREGECVTCQGRLSGVFCEISVRDTGAGMTAEQLEKAFEPFFTTKEIGKGTGLGLSTTLGIVQNHGGHISIDSESGRGTFITMLLPLANCEKQDS